MNKQQIINEIKQIVEEDLNITQLEELYIENGYSEEYLKIKNRYYEDGIDIVSIWVLPMFYYEISFEWLNKCNFDQYSDKELEDILNEYRKLKVKENK